MVNGSDMTFLTYFNNLLEIQSTPVLVLGFKLSMILLVMSTVIGWKVKLHFFLQAYTD